MQNNTMANLPQGWEVKKLGDIAEISSGGTPSRSKKEYWDNGTIPWVKIKDIKEKFISTTEEFITEDGLKNSSAKLFKKGTLLYSIFATLGEVAILDIDATTNQAIAGINIKENNINSLYLMYFLRSIKDEISNKGRGVAQNNLNLSILKQIEIPLPPLKEQERIVGILDESFAKIDESIKILEQDLLNLDELMQSALQKAFNPLKDNAKENYKLPQAWEWKSLDEICEIVMGQSPNGNCIFNKDKNKDLIEFHQGKIAFSDKYINKSDFVTSDIRKIAKKNSVVLSVRAPVGEVNITSEDIAIGRGLCSINGIKINNEFLFFYLLTLKKYFNDNSTGSTFKAISTKIVKETKIPLPPLKEQEQIASHLDELSSHVKNLKQNYQAQIKDLQELKKSLLDKAFKGNL